MKIERRLRCVRKSTACFLAITAIAGSIASDQIAIEPALNAIGFDPDGTVLFETVSTAGANLSLQGTSDFSHWYAITNVFARQNYTSITIRQEQKSGFKFFRIIETSELEQVSDPTTAKVIYGEDGRRDVYEVTDPFFLKAAAATCALVYASNLRPLSDGQFKLLTEPFTIEGFLPCEDEPFRSQPTGAFCTGFLVESDVIATAGHCYDVEDLSDLSSIKFVFGFKMLDEQSANTEFPSSHVYVGRKVLSHILDEETGVDYALIKLDRPVPQNVAEPIAIRRIGAPVKGSRLAVIGHPAGLPLKITGDPTSEIKAVGDAHFYSNLDAFGGNSGSPILNIDEQLVEGILIMGALDYTFSSDCFSSVRLPDEESNEVAVRASLFAQYLPGNPKIWVNFNYRGIEKGTLLEPFRTLSRAAEAARDGSVIKILPGESRETIRLEKALRVEASGGIVRIQAN